MGKKTKIDTRNTVILRPVKIIVKAVLAASWLVLVVYLAQGSLAFPSPPPDAFQSQEPADSEALHVRRAYFTNFTREEVIEHYKKQMEHPNFLFLLQRLNYPPEDAQSLIRDQTRSTYLEELTYPLRESLYINGFEPKEAKDEIWYKGVHYSQKITIKYVSNEFAARFVVAVGILGAALWFVHELFEGI